MHSHISSGNWCDCCTRLWITGTGSWWEFFQLRKAALHPLFKQAPNELPLLLWHRNHHCWCFALLNHLNHSAMHLIYFCHNIVIKLWPSYASQSNYSAIKWKIKNESLSLSMDKMWEGAQKYNILSITAVQTLYPDEDHVISSKTPQVSDGLWDCFCNSCVEDKQCPSRVSDINPFLITNSHCYVWPDCRD